MVKRDRSAEGRGMHLSADAVLGVGGPHVLGRQSASIQPADPWCAGSMPERLFQLLLVHVGSAFDALSLRFPAQLLQCVPGGAARAWQDGQPPPRIGTSLLRLASWRAARSGLDGPLMHPETMRQTSAEEAVEALYRHVSEALEHHGDDERVRQGIAHLHERGSGARTQRRLHADGHTLASVVTRCAEMTVRP
ncbi:hypothetical protein [Streptomyces sp. NPDC008265]|uniref:hypothetical protein n=1 Tax=Streptomyces sp. NPDC008265 TaxID=3364824 RepID=UPI0036EEE511